jgi:pimeloyl-ACP methyl ester carboxylesterase
MAALLRIFTAAPAPGIDELAELRYQASIRPGVHEAYAAMFPAPRQRWVQALAHAESDVAAISAPTLIFHGREDRVIPLATSLRLFELIPDAQLHIFGNCGHWTQIEHAGEFNRLLRDFLLDD